jgi:hypothetical protein
MLSRHALELFSRLSSPPSQPLLFPLPFMRRMFTGRLTGALFFALNQA